MVRKSKRSFTEIDLPGRVSEALFLYNESIAVEYIWLNLLRRGIRIIKMEALRIIATPNLDIIKDNVQLAQQLVKKRKAEGSLEYIKAVKDDGSITLDEVFIKHVIKHGFTHAYMMSHSQ